MNKLRKKKETRRKDKMTLIEKSNIKVILLFIFLAFLFAMLIGKLCLIHLKQGDELTRKALNQLTKTESISAKRGLILDRNNKELAINVTKANVFYNMDIFNPDINKYESKEDRKKDIKETTERDSMRIAKVLEVPQEEILSKMKGTKVVKLAEDISREKALELKSMNIYGLSIDDVSKRFYPYKDLAAYVIGFVNNESTGVYGVESTYDEELSGMPGKSVLIKNNNHTKIPLTDEENYAPKDGLNVVLTIDENIQKVAEEVAKKTREDNNADKVGIIVQDTKNGEILAMATNESYNLNKPYAPINEIQKEEWEDLSNEEKMEERFNNWLNFCVNEQYEPGSTFKLITAAAALEEGTTSVDKSYICNGVYTDIPGVKIGCTSPHRGPRTLAEAIEESCNITLVKVGRELGAKKMYKYIKAFGFGKPTGIDLPAEAAGIIAPDYKSIGPANLATMSYGHGISVTPIQLINAVSCIGNNGYLNTPRVVSKLVDERGNVVEKKKTVTKRKVISDETAKKVKYMMGRVVDSGSGVKAQVPGYKIGGKTGTANIVGKRGYENAYNASFVGLAPLNDPKITVLVVVNRPRGAIFGSAVAAPAAQQVMEKTLEYLKIPKTEKVDEKDKKDLVSVPNLRNLLLSDAGKKVVDLGLKFNTTSDTVENGAVVVSQDPQAGTYVEKGSIIDIKINNNTKFPKIMPQLVGKSEKEVKSILKDMKLEYNINGEGKVISQKPEPGTKIDSDNVVVLKMESMLYEDENKDEDLKESSNSDSEEKKTDGNKDSEKEKSANNSVQKRKKKDSEKKTDKDKSSKDKKTSDIDD